MHFLIIGTYHHVHVRQDNSVPEESCSFEAILRSAIDEYCPDALVEEMSLDAMPYLNATSTIPGELSLEFGRAHLMCDPGHQERMRAGIESDLDVRRILEDFSDAEFYRRQAESFRRRECYWLDRIFELDCERILFVCGDAHVDGFCSLLDRNGHTYLVLERDWPPGVYS